MTSSKRAVASIQEDEVRAHVVGDVKVDPAVVVEVGGDDPRPRPSVAADAGGLGHIGEGPIAVIPIEHMPGRGGSTWVSSRPAASARPSSGNAAPQ